MKRIGLMVIGLSLAACTRSSHLTAAYGKSFRETWRAQRAGDGAIAAQAVKGLDSEEATIVATGYRQSLAPQGTRSSAQPELLYVAPPDRGAPQAPQLAPSVPRER
jgi:hypothetical protein